LLRDAILKRAEEKGIKLNYNRSMIEFSESHEVVKPILEYVISVAMMKLVGRRDAPNNYFPINFSEDAENAKLGGGIQKKNRKSTRRRNRK